MRTVFMGSPEFAVPCLHSLHKHSQLVAVVCQPDKPAGRGQKLQPPAVKVAAEALNLPVLQPTALRPSKSNFVEELRKFVPELIVVVAYGRILPPEVLALPQFGCWNVHGSILPRYRGAAPIQWSLIRGESRTGVTLMQMDEGLDTGPMLRTIEIPIEPSDTAGTLHEKLSLLGAQLLDQAVPELVQSRRPPVPTPQDNALSTLAPLLDKEHGRADFTRSAKLVCGQLRGVDPWPGGYTLLPAGLAGPDAVPMKLFLPLVSSGRGRPGEVLDLDRDGLHIACGEGAVVIREAQLPGRKRLPMQALCAGLKLPRGTIFDDGRPNPLLG